MGRPALGIGQNTIANCTPKDLGRTPGKRGHSWYMQWQANVDGETKRHTTRIHDATRQQVYDQAYRQYDKLVEAARLPGDGAWTRDSRMADFVRKVAIPKVQANEYAKKLRHRSIESYVHRLELFAQAVGRKTIASAVVPSTIEKTLKSIAAKNGNPTAKYVRKCINKYLMNELVRRQIIEHNPLRSFSVEATVAKEDEEPQEEYVPPSNAERKRVVEHLLTMDCSAPARKRWSAEQQTAKRTTLCEMTLLQATYGFRIGEIRHMRLRDVQVVDGVTCIVVPKEVSKTDKSRVVPLVDPRVAERIERRVERLSGGPEGDRALLFASPVAGKLWEAGNCNRSLKKFYQELAAERGIKALDYPGKLTHIWRTALNREWTGLGISDAWRSAYLGHGEEVNREYYTDFSDVSELARQLRAGVK